MHECEHRLLFCLDVVVIDICFCYNGFILKLRETTDISVKAAT